MQKVHDSLQQTLLTKLYSRFVILLTSGKHLHDHIISQKGGGLGP